MPPAGMPRPDQPTLDAFLTYLKTELDSSDTANPGNFPARRLNRTEYTNAVRDLLGIRIDGRALLPADDSRHGFDNVADALTVSPSLLERYLSAARKIRRLALGDPTVSPVFETYNLPRYLMQDERISENLPFGSRGGIAIHHHFPLDGEYVIKVRLQTNSRGYIRGLGEPHQLDVLLDGARIKRFTIGGEHRGESAKELETM